jgi:hypothetical protein
MLRRPLACLTLLSLLSCSVSAQTLAAAISTEASRLAQAPSAVAPNPNKKMALALMAGGAALLVIGLSESRGVQATTNSNGTAATVSETGGSKTALEVLGVLTAAGGGFLYWQGEQKRKPRTIGPAVRVSGTGVVVGTRLTF